MPEKNVREMSKFERLHYSLASRSFRMTLAGSIVLGVVALLIGLGLYTYSLVNRYISEAYNLSKHAAGIIDKIIDPGELTNQVMDIYAKSRADGTAESGNMTYNARFSEIEIDADYRKLKSTLEDFRNASNIKDVYFAMYDTENNTIVYIADPGEQERPGRHIGDFRTVSRKEIDVFFAENPKKTQYHIEKTDDYGWMCTAGVPVYNDAGEITGFFLSDVTLGDVGKGMLSFFIQYAIGMAIVVNLVGILLARRIKKKLADPINAIADAAVEFSKDRINGVRDTDHFGKLNIKTGDELEALWLVLKDVEHDLADYEENLMKITAEKERVGTELELATRIQADMLPSIYPAFPDRDEFDIYATMDPAKEVGGDFYDFFLIDDDHLGMVMADVSGKGVPAALFMMVSKIIIQNTVLTGKSPEEVLEAVNNQFCSGTHEEMFVTVWLGILELSTGKIIASNAGHEYPVIKRRDGVFELFKDKHGFVIGGMPGVKYKNYEVDLQPGDKLFVYTDGLPEATNADSELFGTRRMLDALNQAKDLGAYDMLAAVKKSVTEFVGDASQFDDLTMLCMEYIGKGEKKMDEITIEATVENITTVTDFVNGQLEKYDCPMKAQMQIDVAIDELFGNIAHYAYDPATGPATVRVEVEEEPLAVVITFIDNGKPYDPLKREDPDVTLGAEERDVGGLGIFLVKKTMDDISYEYRNGQNILKIKKQI